MKDLQYYHHRSFDNQFIGFEFTACVNVPPKDELLKFINDLALGEVEGCRVSVGYTIVDKRDQYCKAIGRQKAYINKLPYTFGNVSINTEEGNTLIILSNEEISLFLELKRDRNRVYLVRVEV